MSKINWQNLFIVLALGLAALGVFVPQQAAPAEVVSPQAFQCAPSTMCVTAGGKVVQFPSGSTLKVESGATFTATDFTADTITATSLISQIVSFVGDSANITDTLLVETLTVTGTATADGFTATYLTGTLGTAAQPNVTSVGGLTSLAVGGGYASTGCALLAIGDINCAGVANIGGAVNITGTISKSGVSFTGVMKWGAAAVYTSGESITHGFATTPTVCILQPARDVTSTLTITATGFSSDMATVEESIYWMCGQ